MPDNNDADEYAIPPVSNGPPVYHIRIDSSVDGVVFDDDARGFLLCGSRLDGSTGFDITRGFNNMEAYGHAQWQLDHLQDEMHDGDYQTEALDS